MIARNYRTSKGTDLPLLDLRGKQYLEVKYRLVWFREDHPDWSIETELISVTDVSAYAKATIRDDHGRVIATSHKFESIQGFPDFIEKAETGSIGRALALIGYGTQFCADELDEGGRIVDAPAQRVTRGGSFKVIPQRRENASPAPAAKAAEPVQETGQPADESGEAAAAEASVPFSAGDYMISFGRKYKGRKLKEIPRSELESYLEWLEKSAAREGTQVSYQVKSLRAAFERMSAEENGQQH